MEQLSSLKMRKCEARCWLSDIATLKFTRMMMKQKVQKILKQVLKSLINVNLTGKLVEGREHLKTSI